MQTTPTAALRHRLNLRLDVAELEGVRALAARSGVSLNRAIELLVRAGLAEGQAADGPVLAAEQAALAALLAAEHALKLLEVWIPDGARRAHEVRALAGRSARRRLDEVREADADD